MIEPTHEMVKAFGRVWRERYQYGSSTQANAMRVGLAAVLAIVERDYHVTLRADMPYKGWLIEHVDLHDGAPVEGCTFCPAPPVTRTGD